MGHRRTQQISEGAMMVALIGVALLINRQFAGILEYAMYWVLSFPILIYTVRYGVKQALLPAFSMVLLAFILAMPTTIFYLVSALFLGIVYGGGVRSKWSNKTLLILSGFLTLISYFITMVVFANLFGFDPQEDILIAQKMMEILHIDTMNITQIALIFSLLLAILTAVLQTVCVHLFAILIMRRMKLAQLPTKTIFDFQFPRVFGYISICIWVLFYMRNVIKLEGTIFMALIVAYTIMCILLCSECIMTSFSVSIALQKRSLAFLSLFVIIVLMAFSVSRNVLILFGIYSCIMRPRAKLKVGVLHGTIRKS